MKMIRQGDIVFSEVNKLPKGARIRKNNTVALGETTGHHHTLATDTLVTYDVGDDIYASILEPVMLTHQEHAHIKVEPAVYKVIRQREYSPKENRRVLD